MDDFLSFPPVDNKHLVHLKSQVDKMKEGESKHVEVDDRFNVFLKCDGDDRYTGWIYYIQGVIPTMTFENATLNQIVADAYEQNIFTNESAGAMYNRFSINQLESTLTEELEKEAAYKIEAARNTDHEYRGDIIDDGSVPTGVMPHSCSAYLEDNGNGILTIRILKSIAAELIEKYPDLKATEVVELLTSRFDELVKSKGGQRANHKYIRREGSPGNYRYIYQDENGKEYSTDKDKNKIKDKEYNRINTKINQLKTAGMKGVKYKGDNWFEGKLDGVEFRVKMYDGGFIYGINGTRISEIGYKDPKSNKYVVFYDRGFDDGTTHDPKILDSLDSFIEGVAHKDDADLADVPNRNKWNDKKLKKLSNKKKAFKQKISSADKILLDKYTKNIDKNIKAAVKIFDDHDEIVNDIMNSAGYFNDIEKLNDKADNSKRENREVIYDKIDVLERIESKLFDYISEYVKSKKTKE